MKCNLTVPPLGDHSKSCVLARWHKNDNAHVIQGDLIATVETEKATMDIEAEYEGSLYHSVEEGMPVMYGESIGYILAEQSVQQDDSWTQRLALTASDLRLIDERRGQVPRDAFLLQFIREALRTDRRHDSSPQ
jgi:pyruvate/2-oxoglutarate dehydrogenase complex dihydrolipoamide acyltransferase (E2) component